MVPSLKSMVFLRESLDEAPGGMKKSSPGQEHGASHNTDDLVQEIIRACGQDAVGTTQQSYDLIMALCDQFGLSVNEQEKVGNVLLRRLHTK